MIPEEIYELGDILGLEHKEIKDFILDKSNLDVTFSPLDNYKVGLYGTISINDF